MGSTRTGEKALRVLLRGRKPDSLSAEETRCLLKAYNWAGKNKDHFELAKRAFQRWGDQFLPDVDRALQCAYYWPRGAYVAAADELIREGIGPASHWFLRKADWWVREATGEHNGVVQWYPGDEIVNQGALEQAALELDGAIRYVSSGIQLPDASWLERYAPLFGQPRYARFRLGLDGA
jgi:hypothetical protein